MDDEIEDIVGDVKLTESQKSVTISNVYSLDFTDSSSEKHNSSGMDTYVLELDSEESESSAVRGNVSVVGVTNRPAKPMLINRGKQINRASTSTINKCSIIAQEIFTQTSKTIIELAEIDGAIRKPCESKTIETQTSYISITENKTVEYRIEVTEDSQNVTTNEMIGGSCPDSHDVSCHQIFTNSNDDYSSKSVISDTENDKWDCNSDNSSDTDKRRSISYYKSNDNILLSEDHNEYENTSDFDHSPSSTDMDEDSLMEPKRQVDKIENRRDGSVTPGSVDDDVAELYNKLSESMEFRTQTPTEHEKKHCGYLTPLSEETTAATADAPAYNDTSQNEVADKDVLFTNNSGIKVKLFPKPDIETEIFKLPPIQSNSISSDNLNLLFTSRSKLLTKNGNLPYVHEERKEIGLNWWEMGGKNPAAGECAEIIGRSDWSEYKASHSAVQLPPIHAEGCAINNFSKTDHTCNANKSVESVASKCPISITEKIKELKLSHKPKKIWTISKVCNSVPDGSVFPRSVSPDRPNDAKERGCELLCVELLKRLRSHSWFEVADALDDLPRVLDKFWGLITEQRIADLIRQVTLHVESPRTQVARGACNTLAMILKNTKYTKKPDFYEAVTILLIKTGSFSRPVRRAANVALDEIVCSVELSHSVTALCIHGSCHKSALVRCASARLLVVCCALGSGGRDLLRARPPTAAYARKHALRSLAMLLDDKNSDARKYAERLYTMLRPLSNFEAYYLTDVDVDLASRQMKKYDQLLLCGPQETR